MTMYSPCDLNRTSSSTSSAHPPLDHPRTSSPSGSVMSHSGLGLVVSLPGSLWFPNDTVCVSWLFVGSHVSYLNGEGGGVYQVRVVVGVRTRLVLCSCSSCLSVSLLCHFFSSFSCSLLALHWPRHLSFSRSLHSTSSDANHSACLQMVFSLVVVRSSSVVLRLAASRCGLKRVGLGCGSTRALWWYVVVDLVKAGGGCASSSRSCFLWCCRGCIL